MTAQEPEPPNHEQESLIGPIMLTVLSLAAAIVLTIWAIRHDERLNAVVSAPSTQLAAPNPTAR